MTGKSTGSREESLDLEQGVDQDCSGSIALLSDLASTLFERPAIVCLENEEKSVNSFDVFVETILVFVPSRKLIVREAGKAVFSVYTEGHAR